MRVLLCVADTASTHQMVMVQQQVAAPTMTMTDASGPMHAMMQEDPLMGLKDPVFSNYSSSVEEEL